MIYFMTGKFAGKNVRSGVSGLRGLGSQKIDFYFIAFFNSITIQKVNAKVLNRLDDKWKNEVRSTFWIENVFQNFKLVFLEILFLFRFAVIAKKLRFRSVWKFFCFCRTCSLTGLISVLSCKNFWFWEKIRKHEFFVKNFHFLEFSWIFWNFFYFIK